MGKAYIENMGKNMKMATNSDPLTYNQHTIDTKNRTFGTTDNITQMNNMDDSSSFVFIKAKANGIPRRGSLSKSLKSMHTLASLCDERIC